MTTKQLESLERPVKHKVNFTDVNYISNEELITKWLIDGWIEEKSLVCIYGERNISKSYVALTWAYLLGKGQTIYNSEIKNKARTLFIATEGRNTLKPRLKALENEYGAIENGQLYRYDDEWSFDDNKVDDLIETFGNKLDLIIIDSYSASLDDESVNSDSVTRSKLKKIKKIRDECEVTVILIAHSGKNPTKGIMGSSVLGNDIDTEIRVSGRKKPLITLTKQRNGTKEGMVMPFTPIPHIVGKDEKGEPVTNLALVFGSNQFDEFDQQILEAFRECTDDGLLQEVEKRFVKQKLENILYPSGIVPIQKRDSLRTKFNNRTNKLISSGNLLMTKKGNKIFFSERTNEKVNT